MAQGMNSRPNDTEKVKDLSTETIVAAAGMEFDAPHSIFDTRLFAGKMALTPLGYSGICRLVSVTLQIFHFINLYY
jgi:hypothetical protein